MQSGEGRPIVSARVTSKCCTKTLPTSWRTHSSKTLQRKRPNCRGSTVQGVTRRNGSCPPTSPDRTPGACSSKVRSSTIGMNCRCSSPASSRRKRYTSPPWLPVRRLTQVREFTRTPCFCRMRRPAMTRSKVGRPPLSTRYLSCSSRGPSMLRPTSTSCSFRNRPHSSSSSTPLVWRALEIVWRGCAYFFCSSTTFWKNGTPRSVGSPPCQAKFTSGTDCDSMYWRMKFSSVSSLIRNRSPFGKSFSLCR